MDDEKRFCSKYKYMNKKQLVAECEKQLSLINDIEDLKQEVTKLRMIVDNLRIDYYGSKLNVGERIDFND